MADAGTIKLEVATPTGLALEAEVASVRAPSVSGEFGVLPGHLPLLAALQHGVLAYDVDGGEKRAAIGPGFVEAGPDKVLVLTDHFVSGDDVDADAVKSDRAEAEKELAAHAGSTEDLDYQESARKLAWAEAQLGAAG